jgi:FkbM family methyltransferase
MRNSWQAAVMRSYAQNAEDVRLARVFSQRAEGFYIDIGAAHPVTDSVTKHFYDLGWHGIDVEPDPRLAALLRSERPRDRIIEGACSDHDGTLLLHETGDADGWSTAAADVAEYLTAALGRTIATRSVPCFRAICLWEQADGPLVDFLKIDVEGHERDVLAGADLARIRPSVLIVEATRPHRPENTHAEWEDIVLGAEYLRAGFDGLNRWYVAPESAALAAALEGPMSFFDNVERHDHLVVAELLAQTRAELDAERAVRWDTETELARRRQASLAAPRAMVAGVRRVAAHLRRATRAPR